MLSEEEKAKVVIACSAGNHAQGVALAASKCGIKSLICLPDSAPISKVEATKDYGAEVCLVNGCYDDAYAKALELKDEMGYTFVHTFDDEDVIAGQGTVGLEIVNEFADCGLRIIEVRKEQLHKIPKILDELNTNPLKFILFIDVLSFTKDDDNFSALKAILEDSVSAKSNNVVIYATSNRRHLVKENFSDREGDDVHFNDIIQELLSLSERFGIQLTFSRPDKTTYLDIVHNLADKQGITYDREKLDAEAEKFALSSGTHSARAAKQFIDGIVAGSITDIR